MDENVNITYNGRPLRYESNNSRLKFSDRTERITSPYSIRFKFGIDRNTNETFNPLNYSWIKGTWHHVSGRVWEWTYENPIWNNNGAPIFGYNPHFNHIKYTDVIDINASEVKNMDRLFYNINPSPHDTREGRFTYDAGFNFPNVISMEEMFYKSPIDIREAYVYLPKVRNMANFVNLTGVDLHRWDDSSKWYYPYGCGGMNFPIDVWDEKSILRYCDLTNAFKGCINLDGETAYGMYTALSTGSQSATDGCFENCAVTDPDPYSQSLYRNIPSSWK